MRKLMIHLVLAAVAAMMVVSNASAQLTKIANTGGNGPAPFVSWDPTTGLSIFTSNATLNGAVGQGTDSNTTISFTTLTPVAGGHTFNPGTGAFTDLLNAGSFTITDNSTHTVLLSGTFGGSTLSGTSGASSSSLNLNLDSLTYTGGTYFPAGYSPNNGTLAFSFNGTTPVTADQNQTNAFTATDVCTFSAVKTSTTVPEPASFATFGIGMLVMLALAGLAKRRSMAASL